MAARRVLRLYVLFLLVFVVAPSGASDAHILRKFKDSLTGGTAALDGWSNSTDLPCTGNGNWVGVICRGTAVHGLRLDNMNLSGTIDIDTLVDLKELRVLSFQGNSFKGQMPPVKKLGPLKILYLSFNGFSGGIQDDAFDGMGSLQIVYLAHNQFTGNIPSSLTALPKLASLDLEWNSFEGKIPDFRQQNWKFCNLSHNQLEGEIPASLSKMDRSAFIDNKDLCGQPMPPCKRSKKLNIVIIAISVVIVAALAALGAFLFIRRRRNEIPNTRTDDGIGTPKTYFAYNSGQKSFDSSELPSEYRKGDNGNLYFVRNDRESFELQDLLRAGAEVLGGGSFGSSYKATLLTGPTVVVKRFRHMNNMGKEQFSDHMRKLGRLSHPNLLPLVGFFYTKEEKLLISDFVENGSLASHLHARRAPGEPGLDWSTRLRIIKGVVRGLACLYREFPTLPLPHGHLKSSNVLLDHKFMPLLSEYALVPVVNKDHARQFMAAYKSPECAQLDRASRKSDVWCLGILILELLTGKFPANYLKHGRSDNADLSTWVNSVVREEWTGEVFDVDMKGIKNSEEEMLKLLKIGMCCTEINVEKRWEIREALEKIEELKERDMDEDYYSSCASEGEIYSSKAMTDEDFSFLG